MVRIKNLYQCFLIVVLVGVNYTTKPSVVCYVDSITHGAMVDGHSWVYHLSNEHAECEFLNEGRNGRKTSDTAEFLEVVRRHMDADVYVMFIGVNDLKDGTDELVERCVKNMRYMINVVSKLHVRAKLLLVSPPRISLSNMSEENRRKLYNENTQVSLMKLDERYRELASEEGVGFVSLLDVLSPGDYVDGLHPNEMGQKKIAKAIWKELAPELR
jgi:acyl-CoA thioesterase-1